MFKTIVITLIILFSNVSPSWSDNWILIVSDVKGNDYYLDLDSIKKDKDHLYVWILTNLSKPTRKGFFSYKRYRKIDCNLVGSQKLISEYYDRQMLSGQILYSNELKSEWQYPISGSAGEAFIKKVCVIAN